MSLLEKSVVELRFIPVEEVTDDNGVQSSVVDPFTRFDVLGLSSWLKLLLK